MATATRLMTAEELFQLPSDFYCELIDGVLIELSPPGPEHGMIAATIAMLLGNHVRPRHPGVVFGEGGFILRRGLVWVVHPETRRIEVVKSLQERFELEEEDTLTGGEVLPGFSCPVHEVFGW